MITIIALCLVIKTNCETCLNSLRTPSSMILANRFRIDYGL